MDYITLLQGHPEMFFMESLAPVDDARKMGDRLGRFHYQEASDYLRKFGYSTRHFYYNHYNPLAPFCYFRDYVIVDFPFFTADTIKKYAVLESIKLAHKRLGTALRKQDFQTFFAMIDPRLALLVFVQRFELIPSERRYSIFWYLYSRCEWRLDSFPTQFIEEITRHRLHRLSLPGDDEGYLHIYHGSIHGTQPLESAYSWTLDINAAINYADRPDKKARIFEARISPEQVLAYLPWKKEKEIIVKPGSIKEYKEVFFDSLSSYINLMKESACWPKYQNYNECLNPDLFYKPMGIHGLLHTKNVLFMVLLLAQMQGLDEKDVDLLALSALYHDIGRSNDNFDPEHGKESFAKVEKYDLLKLEGEDYNISRFIIENHCVDDQNARDRLGQYVSAPVEERALHLFNTFKDADGLDRVRIMDLDIKQLRTPQAFKLLLVAHQLLDPLALD